MRCKVSVNAVPTHQSSIKGRHLKLVYALLAFRLEDVLEVLPSALPVRQPPPLHPPTAAPSARQPP
jgi:hypothetical protein